ncbi:MAG: amidohydrolase family protein [Clostridiales bacterium]|nr:amidohydrolase family protein [Clostridiales bacterium]
MRVRSGAQAVRGRTLFYFVIFSERVIHVLEILKGNIVYAPALGTLSTVEKGYLALRDGTIEGLYQDLPAFYKNEPVTDYGDKLIMQSFADMHLHAPQYPMLGMGMDLPLMEWLSTYTFKTEARFKDTDYARRVYRKLAKDLITNGTTRVAMFSSLHTEATWILMEELEKAGVTGYVGKVNMDRGGDTVLQETTVESIRETLRWLEGCHFEHIKPILTPRFTPSCTDELMAALGKMAAEKQLYVQSHLSENTGEIALVKELHPDCQRYYETYAKYGLWKDHTLMAHCVHSDARERKAMREAGVVVVHCADSNVNICSGVCPVRQMLREGIWVTLGSDIAGGALLPMYQVITASIRASKTRRMMDDWQMDFITVAEAYYLGTTSGHKYFGAGDGFAVGDKLHAVVIDDSDFTESTRPLTVAERFERAIYMTQRHNIVAVYSDGRKVVG